METRNLETLLWVVRLGGVGAAARHLNLTQPAVTRRIQETERELGGKVLRRQGRNVVPTPLGQACLSGAERILSEVAAMRLAASGKAASSTIRVGLVESVALTWFEDFLSRIEERYPRVQLEIDVDLSNRLVMKLVRRQIDIALVPGPLPLSGVMRVSLGSCALTWLGDPRLRPAGRHLTAAELADLPIISLPQDADVHHSTTRWFEQAGVSPSLIHCCNSLSVVAMLVRRGTGVSLLAPDLFTADLEAGTLSVLIQHPGAPRVEYSAAYLPNTQLAILPDVASLAQGESWFFGPPRRRVNGLTPPFTVPRVRPFEAKRSANSNAGRDIDPDDVREP